MKQITFLLFVVLLGCKSEQTSLPEGCCEYPSGLFEDILREQAKEDSINNAICKSFVIPKGIVIVENNLGELTAKKGSRYMSLMFTYRGFYTAHDEYGWDATNPLFVKDTCELKCILKELISQEDKSKKQDSIEKERMKMHPYKK